MYNLEQYFIDALPADALTTISAYQGQYAKTRCLHFLSYRQNRGVPNIVSNFDNTIYEAADIRLKWANNASYREIKQVYEPFYTLT